MSLSLRHKKEARNKLYRAAFVKVMERYEELITTTGCISTPNFAKQISGGDGFNPRIVKALPSDFIADVELAAKHALKHDLVIWQHFVHYYVKLNIPSSDTIHSEAFKLIENRLQLKVGQELHRRKLHRIFNYFKSFDCR